MAVRALVAVPVIALASFVLHAAFGLGGAGLDPLFDTWVFVGLMLWASGACLARAALRREARPAWTVLGVGLLLWTAGDVYWAVALAQLESPPFPSIADALYLSFYPAMYVAVVLLVRPRFRGLSPGQWLDGGIAALACAALATAVAVDPIVEETSGDAATVATNLAYPVADLLLLALVICAFALSGWRFDRTLAMLGGGLLLSAIADGMFLFQAAEGTYAEGGVLDTLWPASALLVGFAAWQPPSESGERVELSAGRVVAIPAACALVALALVRSEGAAGALALATLLLVMVRMAITFRENQRMLRDSRRESLTDALTGLGNRRRLMIDLHEAVRVATPARRRLLALFDLNGFKAYNDTFGHPAGDHLLARLGQRLEAAMAPYGRAYRLGGDEFCALVQPEATGPDPLLAVAAAALSERGDGFQVDASLGAALLPVDAHTVEQALRVADRRMYVQKGDDRVAASSRQTRDVLLTTLRERQPELHVHLEDVAELCLAVGRRLGMSAEELDETARAAELHDVGKVAIPDAILDKQGPLDAKEWEFMRRHTLIGERILGASAALVPVGRLVRSTHEHYDGRGYPDGLAGEQIPLGARVVAVCDAYDAMVSDRAYRRALSPTDAIAEIRRCAGTQFDPRVVAAFCEVIAGAARDGRLTESAQRPIGSA